MCGEAGESNHLKEEIMATTIGQPVSTPTRPTVSSKVSNRNLWITIVAAILVILAIAFAMSANRTTEVAPAVGTEGTTMGTEDAMGTTGSEGTGSSSGTEATDTNAAGGLNTERSVDAPGTASDSRLNQNVGTSPDAATSNGKVAVPTTDRDMDSDKNNTRR